jgi:hypothetical protein
MGWGSTGGGTTRFEFRPNADELRAESSGNVQGLTKLPDDEWIHVAVTVKADAIITEPDVTLYLNGQVDNDPATGGTAALNMAAGYDVTIARRHTSGRFFGALIDDLRLYDKELTELDIKVISGFVMSGSPDPADGAKLMDAFAILGWTPGPFGVEFDVYLGTNPEPGADELVGRVSEPTHFATGLVEGETYYWRVDDVEADGTTIHTGDLWSFWIPPKGAYNPQPADGQEVTDTETDLSWAVDWNPVMYVVHFGTDADQVTNALAGFGPPLMEPGFDPGLLELGTTYYWRADVFYGTWVTGPVWSFTVSAPEVVE